MYWNSTKAKDLRYLWETFVRRNVDAQIIWPYNNNKYNIVYTSLQVLRKCTKHEGLTIAVKESRTKQRSGVSIQSNSVVRKKNRLPISSFLVISLTWRPRQATFSPAGRLEIARWWRGRCTADVTRETAEQLHSILGTELARCWMPRASCTLHRTDSKQILHDKVRTCYDSLGARARDVLRLRAIWNKRGSWWRKERDTYYHDVSIVPEDRKLIGRFVILYRTWLVSWLD